MSILDALNAPFEPEGAWRLTDEQVSQIRALYATGGYRQVDLAAEFGVCQPEISRIVNYKRRKN